MHDCHVSVPIPHWEKAEGDEMEKYHTNTMETSSSLCPTVMKSLEPAKPRKRVSFDLPEMADRHAGTQKEKVTTENKKDFIDSTATTITGTGYTATTPMDPEAAKEAVLFMGCPQPLVQLVMDLRHQDAQFHFCNAQQLYQLVCQLVNHPERQARLLKKCYPSQKPRSSPASGDAASGTGYTAATTAEGDIGQEPPAAMSEGSLRSTKATSSSSSSSFSSSSSSSLPASSLSAAAVATECCSPAMVAAPGTSVGGYPSLPKIVPSASASEEAGKTTTASSELLPTTLTSKPREEDKVEKNLPKVTTSIVEGDPKSEVLETSSKDTAAVTSAAVESKPSDTSKASSTEQLRERVKTLARENWRLTQRKLCRACRKVELSSSGVTFLPCGHFITCEDCSEKFDDCPACGKTIMGTVRTFLS